MNWKLALEIWVWFLLLGSCIVVLLDPTTDNRIDAVFSAVIAFGVSILYKLEQRK